MDDAPLLAQLHNAVQTSSEGYCVHTQVHAHLHTVQQGCEVLNCMLDLWVLGFAVPNHTVQTASLTCSNEQAQIHLACICM